jgi:hypothetical protein
MKKIGTLENNYAIYWKSKGHFRVEFQHDGHTISLADFEYFPRLSEETSCFAAALVLDGILVGDCSNEGRGGCANYHAFNHWDLARTIDSAVRELNNYCFPSLHESLASIIDTLAEYTITFGEIKSKKMAENAVIELQEYADKLRVKYSR